MLKGAEIIRLGGPRVPRRFLRRCLQVYLRELNRAQMPAVVRRHLRMNQTLTLVFLTKSKMTQFNKRFRGKNRPTDVLSFAPSEPDSMGELVFSLEVIRAQAVVHQLSYRDELAYMVLHGMLHLMGYDHERSVAAERTMFRLQDRIFDASRRHW